MISGAELLEQSFSLCRATIGSAMVAHWAGTGPMLAGLLYFCQEITGSGRAPDQLVALSLLMAALWIWMNFWHSVCCDLMWRRVSGEAVEVWSGRMTRRALIAAAAIQGPAAFAVCVAALITLPFPWVQAFFQNCHVYSARYNLREAVHRASEHAGRWQRQSWQLIACGVFAGSLLFVNVVVAIVLTAQLLNTLLGVQTALVRNPFGILSFPYLLTALCVTYLLLDPVWKAAYVIRCFHGESVHSGADLRLTLRRFALTLFLLLTLHVSPVVGAPADKYDRAVQEVLRRPEYEWSIRSDTRSMSRRESPLGRQISVLREWLRKVFEVIGEWLRRLSPDATTAGNAPPPGVGLRWSILAAIAVCVLAVLFLALRSRRKVVRSELDSVTGPASVDLADVAVTPDQLPVDAWLQLAEDHLRSGETRFAARAVYLGALAQLDHQRIITIRPHKTNLEYERELIRRSRSMPEVSTAFRRIAVAFESSWYGGHEVSENVILDLKKSVGGLRGYA